MTDVTWNFMSETKKEKLVTRVLREMKFFAFLSLTFNFDIKFQYIKRVYPAKSLEQGLSSWQRSSSEWRKKWDHQCALISHTMLSKTNKFNFYRKKSLKKIFWMKMMVF